MAKPFLKCAGYFLISRGCFTEINFSTAKNPEAIPAKIKENILPKNEYSFML
jgi:hypothetical protein